MREISFTSAAGSELRACIWTPPSAVTPCAVLQIVHNFAEDVARYADFAEQMTRRGYIVCAHSQFAPISPNAHDALAKDVFALTEIAKKQYSLPIILVGVGTGSLVARYAVSLWGIEYSGAIFVGSMQCRNAFNFLQRRLSVARLINRKENRGAWQTMLTLARIVNYGTWLDKIPKNLPIYLLSGLNDPVGGMGRGIIQLYSVLENSGCAYVGIRLQEDVGHDVLFCENMQEVYDELTVWLDENVLNPKEV